jgi:3-oxoadipate enol-lactonase
MMQILFGHSILADPARTALIARWRKVVDGLPKSILRAASASALRGSVAEEIGRITAPTLIIAGEEDHPVPLHHQQAVAAAIPGAVIEVVPVTGHAVMIEQPEWFNARLARFLASDGVAGRA